VGSEKKEKCQSVKVSECQAEDRGQRTESPVGVPSGTIISGINALLPARLYRA